MFNKFRFNRICRRIKAIKIQGATSVARAALKAYYLVPTKESKKILLSLRPTEPMLSHVISLADKLPKKEIIGHFSKSQDEINKQVFVLLQDKYILFTHCHSTNVVKALIYAKEHGRHFQVYNTETRPLFQGRQTAKELSKAGIPVTNFVDSAAAMAIKKSSIVLLGADAILKDSIINKVGSGMFSEIAFDNNVPVYIISDSWKYAHKSVKLEQRNFKEVWNPKTNKIHLNNPAFEPIDIKYIKGIISELGVLSPKEFVRRASLRKD